MRSIRASTESISSRPSAPERAAPPEARRSERGSVVIITVILMLVVIGFAGIAIDGAMLATAEQQLQHAADAGALAGVRMLATEWAPHTLSRQQVIDIAFANSVAGVALQLDANTSNAANGDIVVGIWDPIALTFTPDTFEPNAVRVHARRTAGSLGGPLTNAFGAIFGVTNSETMAVATATFGQPGGGIPLILALEPTRPEVLRLAANDMFTVNGKIHSNSSANCAISLGGNAQVTTTQASSAGTACYGVGQITGPVVDSADVLSDPLADVLPAVADWNAYKAGMTVQPGSTGTGGIDDSGTYPPGYYPEGVNLESGDVVTLDPGVYLFGGFGAELDSNSTMSGAGVTLLIDEGSRFYVAGQSSAGILSPPTTGQFAGITVFSHRNNAHTGLEPKPPGPPGNHKPWDIYIAGGAAVDIRGAIYCPSGHTILAGHADSELGAVITNSIEVGGNQSATLTGNGILPINVQPAGYLVE
jgi:Flp pilus assembly protein TadG